MRAIASISLLGTASLLMSCSLLVGRLTKDATCGNDKIDEGEICYVLDVEELIENGPNELDVADFNNDGTDDIVVVGFQPAIAVHLNFGDNFAARRLIDFTGTTVAFPNDVIAFSSPNGDGILV